MEGDINMEFGVITTVFSLSVAAVIFFASDWMPIN